MAESGLLGSLLKKLGLDRNVSYCTEGNKVGRVVRIENGTQMLVSLQRNQTTEDIAL